MPGCPLYTQALLLLLLCSLPCLVARWFRSGGRVLYCQDCPVTFVYGFSLRPPALRTVFHASGACTLCCHAVRHVGAGGGALGMCSVQCVSPCCAHPALAPGLATAGVEKGSGNVDDQIHTGTMEMEQRSAFYAHNTTCPHKLLPKQHGRVAQGAVCPVGLPRARRCNNRKFAVLCGCASAPHTGP